jgi:hypothetical protein
MGGLGNQMFQYAFGRRLARIHRTDLRLDTTWFDRHPSRRYQLDAFRIKAQVASLLDIDTVTNRGKRGALLRLMDSVRSRRHYSRPVIIEERYLHFDPSAIRDSNWSCYCIGYWQSERYFDSDTKTLRDEFQLTGPMSSEFVQWSKEISAQVSISLHIRRGDHIHDGEVSHVHGASTAEYYHRALAFMRSAAPMARVYVFSDDHAWAQDFSASYDCIQLVELTGDRRDQEELMLMSLCTHHIIPNSTYGWWGAWLGSVTNKIVIAPGRWFADASLENHDIIPDSWVRL